MYLKYKFKKDIINRLWNKHRKMEKIKPEDSAFSA